MRLLAAAAVCFMLSTAAPRPASACSCDAAPEEPIVIPPDGSSGVPDTPLLAVRLTRALPGTAFSLRDLSAAEDVPIDVRTWIQSHGVFTWFVATANQPLDPGDYAVHIDGASVSTFSVSATGDDQPPTAPEITRFDPWAFPAPPGEQCQSGVCWERPHQLDQLWLAHEPAADEVSLVLLELYRDGDDTPFQDLPLDGSGTILLGSSTCDDADVELEIGIDYCARLIAYDAAGNAASSERICAAAQSCYVEDCSPFPYDICPTPPEDPPPTPAPADGSGCNATPTTASLGQLLVMLAGALIVRRRRTP
jgi:uncharacterized protein (TIGR03382 family)